MKVSRSALVGLLLAALSARRGGAQIREASIYPPREYVNPSDLQNDHLPLYGKDNAAYEYSYNDDHPLT